MTSLNPFTVKVIFYLQELHQHIKAKTTDVFKKKKKKIVLFLPPCVELENVTGMIETFRVLQDTFSTDNSFHGRLASDRTPFSLFNLGGLRRSDWMFF